MAGTFAIASLGILGYSYFQSYGLTLPDPKGKLPDPGPLMDVSKDNAVAVAVAIKNVAFTLKDYVGVGIMGTATAINPYTWIRFGAGYIDSLNKARNLAKSDMLMMQNHTHILNNTVYPYTRVNPSDPLIFRIIHLFYESDAERTQRFQDVQKLYLEMVSTEDDAFKAALKFTGQKYVPAESPERKIEE